MSATTTREAAGIGADEPAASDQPKGASAETGMRAYREAHPTSVIRWLLIRTIAVFVADLPGARMRLRLYRWMGVRMTGPGIFVGRGCYLDPIFPGFLTLERGVKLAPRVIIQCHNEKSDLLRPVVFKADSWAGAGAIIGPGVTVGEGSVIAAGAVVFSDVPANSIVLGNPARVVGKVPEKGHEGA